MQDLRIVDSTHERKASMAELSDAFIALPGGIGTLEEFLSKMWMWTQPGAHAKPCGLLNTLDFYDGLLAFRVSVGKCGWRFGGGCPWWCGGRVGGRTPVEVDDPRIGVRSNS
ncbi:LOG family protein [Mycolicibacterium baixiangningiae]|uniref:LOG family protein n=1 Tax=Mycolicibacterium baixiangningiae TaxID=2761578 RepID=UPI001E49377A|nr:LOG family protein [Mycolicibacterium baixiangningiae]